ncbi:Cell fate regulator YaaT, PSP1 superfamily (controls sporulation, competence, biofilm development) [Ruminococcaceae bacterium YRB3002]|nr:Cell fate regulator YaaT, PSP1 superfamily (controls sporulation, competence, biofilm development) [Ruminococcaceae bacterium YRB3002]
MTKVVNCRFREAGRVYRYKCDGMSLGIGDMVMVNTNLGEDIAHVIEPPYVIPDDREGDDLIPVLRKASEAEKAIYSSKVVHEKEAFAKRQKFIEDLGLDMNLCDTVFAFDGKKIVFYFTADNRVDFRELVKVLAAEFRVRIELRQIGSRDEAKLVGGIGICGREMCCCTFLNHFAPVTLRMARDQGLALNPGKLNGACGRLMCCLQFEKEAYEESIKRLPKVGKKVRTPLGTGIVSDVELISETVSVKFTNDETTEIEKYKWEELAPLNPKNDDDQQ